MAISGGRGVRALAVGLLVLLLVVSGAVPAAAGAPGPAGSAGGRNPAGPHGDGGHEGSVTAKQGGGGPAPAARKSQGTAPRPPRQSATAPRTAKPAATAPAKPTAAKPSPARTPKPAERKPERQKDAHAPDREVDDEQQRRRTSKSPDLGPMTEDRSSTVSTARQTVSRGERPSPVPASVRTFAATLTSSADPTAALFAPPPVVRMQAAAVDLEPPRLWPRLPGPAGHPAFPGLLVAVLLGFIVLGFRGDRRDPKLVAAPIDDRDDRAEFR